MRILTLFRACLLVLPLLVLWPFSADAAESSWSFQTAAATQKAPTVTLARNGLPEPAVKTCYCCEGEECQCGPGCQCIRVKAKSAPEKKPAKIAWDWSKGEVKIFDDQEAAQKWKESTVQAPILWSQGGRTYDVPVFSNGRMYGTPVEDIRLLGPPPPDIVGESIVTTIPMQRFAAPTPCVPAATYYPTAAAAIVPTYQYQQQSYYYPGQQTTNVQVQRRGLFGLQRSYNYQQSYTPPQVATYGSYQPAGGMICGPGGCSPGG